MNTVGSYANNSAYTQKHEGLQSLLEGIVSAVYPAFTIHILPK